MTSFFTSPVLLSIFVTSCSSSSVTATTAWVAFYATGAGPAAAGAITGAIDEAPAGYLATSSSGASTILGAAATGAAAGYFATSSSGVFTTAAGVAATGATAAPLATSSNGALTAAGATTFIGVITGVPAGLAAKSSKGPFYFVANQGLG